MNNTIVTPETEIVNCGSETPVRRPESGGNCRPQLVGGFKLFVPYLRDPADWDGIRAALGLDSPVGMALSGGGVLEIAPEGERPVILPVRTLGRLPVETGQLDTADGPVAGLILTLPPDLTILQAAVEQLERGLPYTWAELPRTYLDALGRQVGHGMKALTACRISGMQAQVVTDSRLGRDGKHVEMGLAPRTARRLLRQLKRQDPARYGHLKTLDGALVLLMRYPVLDKGAQWAKVVLMPDRIEGPIYVNPTVWKEEFGGDEDGDGGFTGHAGEVVTLTPRVLPEYPRFTVLDSRPVLTELVNGWRPLTPDAAVSTVMKMLTKDLTGPLTYVMHVLARTTAVEYARQGKSPAERRALVARSTRAVMRVAFPLTERVMDGKKLEEDLASVYGMTLLLQQAVAGQPVTAEPFRPFLTNHPHEMNLLGQALSTCGNSLENCRTTAYGRLVAAGRKITEAGPKVAAALLSRGIPAERILDCLLRDMTGEEFFFLKQSRRLDDVIPDLDLGEDDLTEAERELFHGQLPITGDRLCSEIAAGLETLTLRGQRLFSVLKEDGVKEMADGSFVVRVRLDPVWLGDGRATCRCELVIPAMKQVTRDGHLLVTMPGARTRMYRPRFLELDGKVVEQPFAGFLLDTILRAVQSLPGRKGKNGGVTTRSVTLILNDELRKAVMSLSLHTAQESLIQGSEFQVVVDEGLDIRGKWEQRQRILSELCGRGFDVVTTSKSKPGTLVTRAGEHGLPRYMLACNPLARFLDPKRRVELREIRQALPLWAPSPLKVKAKGYRLPAVLAGCVRELTVMVADVPGLNQFVDSDGAPFGFDTILATQGAVHKLAIAGWEKKCDTLAEKERVVADLREQGFAADDILVTETGESMADGVLVHRWVVSLNRKIEDAGKIKAAVGPIKGVMNVIPHRLYARNPDGSRTEIDLIVPRDTILRKKGLDAVLYMLAAKAGVVEIDPSENPRVLRRQIQARLVERDLNPEGLQEVVALYADGTKADLGEAIVGPLPFFRPVQTGFGSFKMRSGENGIKVEDHTTLMLENIPFTLSERFRAEFASLVNTWVGVGELTEKEVAMAE